VLLLPEGAARVDDYKRFLRQNSIDYCDSPESNRVRAGSHTHTHTHTMVDINENPVVGMTMTGGLQRGYDNNMLGRAPSVVVAIDSRDRDRCRYKRASNFRIKLPRVFRGVYTVRLLKAIVPFHTDWYPERYVVLRCPELEVMEGAKSQDYHVTNPVADLGFAVFSPGPSLPTTGTPAYAPRTLVYDDLVFHKVFSPPRATLSSLSIELWLRGDGTNERRATLPEEAAGTPTAAENNLLLEFEIISQA